MRDKGVCPCPRCRMPKEEFRDLGTRSDMDRRKTLIREDDDNRKRKIGIAREIIYDKRYAVGNNNVEQLLKPDSLVPTLVR